MTNQPHNRDALATLFWPEASQRRARGNLRQVLSDLNKALDEGRLLVDGEQIALTNSDSFWLDIAEFRDVLASRSEHNHDDNQLCPDCILLLTSASELYTDHFLAGFTLHNCPEFDDWQFFESEELRQALSANLEKLISGFMGQGQYRRALPFARRRLSLDPLHEAAHRQLMKLYALDGQQSAALRQYENCVALLDEELGAEPEAETTDLFEVIKARQFDNLVSDAGLIWIEEGLSQPTPRPLPGFLEEDAADVTAVPTFVVRERELAQLKAALETARSGHGQVMFVIGGAGRVKTMLVEEFARQAQAGDPTLVVVSGHCDAITGIGDPYLPFREALAMLTGDVEAQWAGGLIRRHHARQLWELMPVSLPALVRYGADLIGSFISIQSLQERAAAAAGEGSGWLKQLAGLTSNRTGAELDQSRIFGQYTAILKAIAAERPILFTIEDLHWVDTASSGLLFHLSREMADSQILMIGTYRPEEVALAPHIPLQKGAKAQHPMAAIVSELKRQHGDIWLDLGKEFYADSGQSGRQFVDAYLDTQPNYLDESFRRALFQRTGGHALFTVELVTAMQERGDLQQDEEGVWVLGRTIDWDTLPVKVEGVIERRVERLTEELREILTVASVEGEVFTAEVVAQVQQMAERTLVQQLSRELDKQHRLVTAQALEWVDPGHRRLSIYRFRHQLFHHYLYNRLDEVERTFLHEAVGRALEQMYDGHTEKVAGRLARHFQIAGLLSKAVDYSEQAGDFSAAVFANVEAAAHYKAALTLLKGLKPDTEKLIRLHAGLGRVLELNSEFAQALETYQDMEQLADSLGHQEMELAALIHQGRLRCTTNPEFDPEQGEALSERGLLLARILKDEAAEVRIQGNLVNLYRWTNRSQRAVEVGQAALQLLDNLTADFPDSDEALEQQAAYIHNDLAHCYFAIGSLEKAKESSLKASDYWQMLNNKPMRADSLATAAYIHGYAGEHDKVIAFSDEAWNISESIRNIWGQSYSQFRVGYSYWELGRPDLALAAMRKSLRLGKESGFPVPQVWTQADMAIVYGGLGAISDGLETARLALAVAETQLPVWRAYILGTLAHLHILQGNTADAETAIQEGKKDPYREAYIVYFVPVLLAEAELALKQKAFRRVMDVTEPLLVQLRNFGMRLHFPDALYLQGQALVGMGEDEMGRSVLEEARIETEKMGAKRPLCPILIALSRLESDPHKAEQLEAEARKTAAFIAAHIPEPAHVTLFQKQFSTGL